jgi:hypothetical protein
VVISVMEPAAEEPGETESIDPADDGAAPEPRSGPPKSGVLVIALAVVMFVSVVTAFFGAFAFGLGGLQEQRSQHQLYSQFRGVLDPSSPVAPRIGGNIPDGTPVALLNSPTAGLRDVPGRRPVVGAQERVAAPVAEQHRPAEEGPVGSQQQVDQTAAISSGRPGRPTGMGSMSSSGPASASARMPATIGVSIMPGAMALSRSPPGPVRPGGVPAHPVGHRQLGGRVGHQEPTSSAIRGAQLLVVARQASTRSAGMAGCTVVEFELMATAAPPGPATDADPRAGPPCRSSSRRPAASRPGPAARPARHRSRCRPARRRSVRTPSDRGGGPRGWTGRPRRRTRPCRRR